MDNEFDYFEDDFAEIDGVDWDDILSVAPSVAVSQPADSLPEPGSPASSNYRLLDVFYDLATLEEIDELEQRALTQMHESSALGAPTISEANPLVNVVSPSNVQTSRYFHNHDPNMTVSIRDERSQQKKRRFSSPPPRTPSKKNKTAYDNLESASSIEDELMCPICCDILVATHVANPCGHSFCGSCGELWTIKNKNDRCPICRTRLARDKPLIPNIAMDNVIERYIQMLGRSGSVEWTKGGEKFQEWCSRKHAWKQEAAKWKNATSCVYDVSYVEMQALGEGPSTPFRSPRRRRRNRRRFRD